MECNSIFSIQISTKPAARSIYCQCFVFVVAQYNVMQYITFVCLMLTCYNCAVNVTYKLCFTTKYGFLSSNNASFVSCNSTD